MTTPNTTHIGTPTGTVCWRAICVQARRLGALCDAVLGVVIGGANYWPKKVHRELILRTVSQQLGACLEPGRKLESSYHAAVRRRDEGAQTH